MRYIQRFDSASTEQAAIDAGQLGKPYIAFIEDGQYIDWNGLNPTQENWVDIRTIDNNTPIYNVAWKDGGFSNINDTWFSEASGLVCDALVDDGDGWRAPESTTEAYGYYMWHRMSSRYRKYTCTFIPEGRDGYGADLGYGISEVDAFIRGSSLAPIEINGETYYALGLVNWQNWKPLYMPLSTNKIQSTYIVGGIMVDIGPKS